MGKRPLAARTHRIPATSSRIQFTWHDVTDYKISARITEFQTTYNPFELSGYFTRLDILLN